MSGQRSLPVSRDSARCVLGSDDPPAFRLEEHGATYPAVVVCDHASNAVPRSLEALGLTAAQLSLHIAWDVGAAALARHVAQQLSLPLIAAGFSRLVIDCNRHLEDPGSILRVSDGQAIPGNAALDVSQRAERAAAIFHPYHAAVETALQQAAMRVAAPALIAIHSFTPVMRGFQRPWHCGILWDKDPRIPQAFIQALRRPGDVQVGDNEPYSGRDPADYTVSVHAESRGWPHVCIEVRQDLLQSAQDVAAWGRRLAAPLKSILANSSLYEVARY